jgi:hypothetical protein
MGKMRKKIKYGPIIHGDRPEINNYPGYEKHNLWRYDRKMVRVIDIDGGKWLEVGCTENACIVCGINEEGYFTLLRTPFGEGKNYVSHFLKEFAGDALDLEKAKEYFNNKILYNVNTGDEKHYGSDV